jgi:hypothetical protein
MLEPPVDKGSAKHRGEGGSKSIAALRGGGESC